MSGGKEQWRPHMAHWGGFEARSDGERLLEVRPLADDPAPVALIENAVEAQHHDSRVDQPYVRERWLKEGPGAPGRGEDRYVRTSWEEVLRLTAGEIERVYATTGPESVFGGSYGWSSAGRFHHAQSQVHRFLNTLGGYVASVGNYSFGASQVLLPHVVGSVDDVMAGATSWESIAEHTDLFVAFGGLPAKNVAVSPGGIRRHAMRGHLAACRERGTEFVHVSPLRDDAAPEAQSRWIPARPGTDAALLCALAYVVVRDGLLDRDFVDGWCVGYEKFESYLLGDEDGVARTPEWAEGITGVGAAEIVDLAHQMARGRTMITVSWSLQRARHGEQPVWLAIVLAAMLGQIGLPGGGFGHGYGSMGYIGTPRPPVAVPALPQGGNPVETFIPVARIADMLLGAGETYEFDGQQLTYPDIRLVYWCGGNPFHHHQDLARLRSAFAVPETVIVHESHWTATARHADIVLPASMTIERNDFAQGKNEPFVSAMPRLTAPAGLARSDYEIFTGLAERLGVAEEFTAGRDEEGWLRHLYGQLEERLRAGGPEEAVPSFDQFWEEGVVRLPEGDRTQTLFADFRADPQAHPLGTPSGRIEVFSSTIDAFGYDDFPGHPAWIEPEEWLGSAAAERFPLHLVANQPRGRLHSQLADGAHSRSLQVAGREPLRMSPADARARDLADGDLVEVASARGRCLAGLVVSEDLREGVVQLATGARFAPFPDDPAFCQNGNPNVLTADRPTSRLTQGCAGQHALVQVRRADEASATFVEPPWRSAPASDEAGPERP